MVTVTHGTGKSTRERSLRTRYVSGPPSSRFLCTDRFILQMKEYWPKRLGRADRNPALEPDATASGTATPSAPAASAGGNEDEDEYDRICRSRLFNNDSEDGWKAELQRYLDDPAAEVTKQTDPLEWWSVRHPPRPYYHNN